MKKKIAVICAALLLALVVFMLPAAAIRPGFVLQGRTDIGRLDIVTGPDNTSDYLSYYQDQNQLTLADVPWLNVGTADQGIAFQNNNSLRISKTSLGVSQMTLSIWVYWRGGDADQRLFTIASSDNSSYITFSPWHMDNTPDGDGNICNGAWLSFHRTGGKLDFQIYQPVAPDTVNTALSVDQWHNVMVTLDRQNLCLYIDGVLQGTQSMLLGLVELPANLMLLGGSFDGSPALDAVVGQTYMYDAALSDSQRAMLAARVDPFAPDAALPAPTDPYLPTAPTTVVTPPVGDEQPQVWLPLLEGTWFGLPKAAVASGGAVLALFLAATLTVNVVQGVRRLRRKSKDRQGTDWI